MVYVRVHLWASLQTSIPLVCKRFWTWFIREITSPSHLICSCVSALNSYIPSISFIHWSLLLFMDAFIPIIFMLMNIWIFKWRILSWITSIRISIFPIIDNITIRCTLLLRFWTIIFLLFKVIFILLVYWFVIGWGDLWNRSDYAWYLYRQCDNIDGSWCELEGSCSNEQSPSSVEGGYWELYQWGSYCMSRRSGV